MIELDSLLQYKNLEIEKNLNSLELKVLEKLENYFSKNQIFFQIIDRKIVKIYIREINLIDFKNKTNELINIYNINKNDNIFNILINKIESIKSYGIKNGKRIYVNYNKERKVKDRKIKEKKRGKYFYAINNNFDIENYKVPGQLVNQIFCGDSEYILKKFPKNCIDLIFTSPPYNFGLEYENHKDEIDWKKYFKKLFLIFDECIRILKYGGRIIMNVQPLFSDYIPIHHLISKFFIDRKLIWKGEILWEKHNYNCKYTAWGSWKSPSNPYLKYTWEFLEIFCKGTLKHKGNKDNIDLTNEEFKKWVYAKWEIHPETKMKKWGHPAMFPEELAKRVIKLFSFVNDVVLDPFNGIGTTTKVAKELNRKYIGIDISKEYCLKANDRVKEVKKINNLKNYF